MKNKLSDTARSGAEIPTAEGIDPPCGMEGLIDRMLDEIEGEAAGNNVDVVLLKRPVTVVYLAVSPHGELRDIRICANGSVVDVGMVLGQVFPDAELAGLPVDGSSAFAFLKAVTQRETFDKQITADLISKLILFVGAAAN